MSKDKTFKASKIYSAFRGVSVLLQYPLPPVTGYQLSKMKARLMPEFDSINKPVQDALSKYVDPVTKQISQGKEVESQNEANKTLQMIPDIKFVIEKQIVVDLSKLPKDVTIPGQIFEWLDGFVEFVEGSTKETK